MNDGYDWIVDMDLSKFFDNVNQDILMILVHQVIHDPDTESLIRRILQSGVLVEGVFQTTDKGTPQGGLCRAPHNPPYVERDIMRS